MWTPRRLLFLLGGFALFLTGYLAYAKVFGRFDGLKPLPEDYLAVLQGEAPLPPVTEDHSTYAVNKLREAFGPNCPECKRRKRLGWRGRGIVLAFEEWQLLPNGHIELTHPSVAFFGKSRGEGKGPEIITARGLRAVIELDRPITHINEAPNRKPVAGRIEGRIDGSKRDEVELQNNNGTPNRDDDTRLYALWLAYNDEQHRIWTDEAVTVKDQDPIMRKVTATGMEITLFPRAEASAKKQRPNVSGVKQLRLHKHIRMYFLMDPKSGFLGNASAKSASPSPQPSSPGAEGARDAAKDEKNPVVVEAQGPFIYNFGKSEGEPDEAEFHDKVRVLRSPEPAAATPENMTPATALHYDELRCDKLLLRFRPKSKTDKSPANRDRSREPADVIAAHATGREVYLDSGAEDLKAIGNEMIYESLPKDMFRTTLKGDPVHARKADNHIRARGVLVLEGTKGSDAPKNRGIHQARVVGPGEIEMPKREGQPPITARWQKELSLAKDGIFDRVILMGQATFDDTEHGRMQADQLMVWLEPAEPENEIKKNDPKKAAAREGPPAPPAPAVATPARRKQPQRRPKRVEATGNVSVISPELLIRKTDRLWMEFEEVKRVGPATATAAASAPAADGWTGVKTGQASGGVEPRRPPPVSPPSQGGDKGAGSDFLPPLSSSDPAKKKPRPQIELTAGSVDVWLRREGDKAELNKLHTKGRVHVLQKPVSPEDKLLEIKGETLQLSRSLDGHILQVFGAPADVQLDDLFIRGPDIRVDQPTNEAAVKGMGHMKHPTREDLNGDVLPQPMDLIIHWRGEMYFNGQYAVFHDGVQADQGTSWLSCRELHVFLDKPVSFKGQKQTGKKEPEPAVSRLMCEGDVHFTKAVREADKWREFYGVEGQELTYEKENRERKLSSSLEVKGPGLLRILQPGSAQQTPFPSRGKNQPPDKNQPQEMKLTRIAFLGRMTVEKEAGVARFYDQVHLIHLPADDPDISIDPSKLPPGGLDIRCDKLVASGQRIAGKKGPGEFTATGDVKVDSVQKVFFSARADIVKYNEEKDQLILEAVGSRMATVWKQEARGGPMREFSATKHVYGRKDNSYYGTGARGVEFTPR